jgi:hypothetical protein
MSSHTPADRTFNKGQAVKRALQAALMGTGGYVVGRGIGESTEAIQGLVSPFTGMPPDPNTDMSAGNIGALAGAIAGGLGVTPLTLLAQARRLRGNP